MNVDPNLTKYMIKIKLTTDGVVEKPDVVGAIFGQTEGLLGEELDLRDLQKSGKIGRIEVDIDSKKGKTEGTALIPSGLDQVETSILAASLETIDRIGPCKAKVEVVEIEDVREAKRKKIVERAEELYKKMNTSGRSVSENLVKEVREEVERSEIITYGEEKLPAGPAIKDSDSIIVVEGRNDVLNLLRYGIKNTIAVQGTNIPQTVAKLSREKTVTVFLDGDRGGDLILKEMLQVAEVDFVARAPPGTEVEELTYKQVYKALRYKTPLEQYLSSRNMGNELKNYREKTHPEAADQITVETTENNKPSENSHEKDQRRNEKTEKENEKRNEQIEVIHNDKKNDHNHEKTVVEVQSQKKELSVNDPDGLKKRINELNEKKMTEIYINDKEKPFEVSVVEAPDEMDKLNSVNKVITGGVISQRLIDIAQKKGAEVIYGYRKGNITKIPASLRIVSLMDE
ncbi:DNA primase DnaG [Caldiplasma sukawensis]